MAPVCDYCGEELDEIPHSCKFCKKIHCSKHLLPENHNCQKLKEYSIRKSKNWRRKANKILSSKDNRKQKPFDIEGRSSKSYKKPKKYSKKENGINRWLMKRDKKKYSSSRFNYFANNFLAFVFSIVSVFMVYSNYQEISKINLWVFDLGGLLILASAFFLIKHGWRVLKETINLAKRQRRFVKILIIIFLIVLGLQIYSNLGSIETSFINFYKKINFSYISPFSLDTISSNSTSRYSDNNSNEPETQNFLEGIYDPKSKIDRHDLEKAVHKRINEERIYRGLEPLNWDKTLAKISREHSKDMIERDFYSHDNPDGQGPTERSRESDYFCKKNYGSYHTEGVGENIAKTPIHANVVGCGSTTDLNSLADCIVDGWMDSPGHRKNILTESYKKTGIGIAYSEDNIAYSTQNFC